MTFMDILTLIAKYTVSISDIILFACIGYFMRGLRWENEKERASIVGFNWMMITIAASVVCLWV